MRRRTTSCDGSPRARASGSRQELDEEHRRELTQLVALSDDELDEEYAAEMVEEHTHDVENFREASKNIKDPELRAWAAKMLPILEEHLTRAKLLKEKKSR
jgi:putative membrane protein